MGATEDNYLIYGLYISLNFFTSNCCTHSWGVICFFPNSVIALKNESYRFPQQTQQQGMTQNLKKIHMYKKIEGKKK